MNNKEISILLDNLPLGILRFDNDKKCIYVNKFILDLCKIPKKCENTLYKIIELIHPEDKSKEMEICKKFLQEKKDCESTFRILNKNKGEYIWVQIKRIYIKNKDIFMYTIQDINENKLLEIKLRDESIKAEDAYNHKSIFLANMHHELRNPVNGIIGMLTLLEDTNLSSDQQDYMYMIKECSFNLMTIINDILDYSKLEVGKITLNVKSMNLLECIESTNDIVLSKIYEKSLDYTYNIDNEINEYIYGDSNRLKQVLLNLISNSIKFTDNGNIFLNISQINKDTFYKLKKDYKNNSSNIRFKDLDTESEESDELCRSNINFDMYLRFDIIDTGCGIEKSERKKLFKSFSQVENATTSKIYGGTGLGLAISKELVELMNGCIWLDKSELNTGSTFSFIIPTKKSSEESIDKKYESENINVLKNNNILIIDNNINSRMSLVATVTKWGMKPYSFSNCEEALHFTKLNAFDIGIVEILMPNIDGYIFAQKLREQNEFNNKTFPLIALSSLGDKEVYKSKFFKTHLIKPIKESRLKKICIKLLNEKKGKQKIEPEKDIKDTIDNNELSLDSYIYKNNLVELKDNVRILIAEDVYINQRVVTSFLNKLGFKNLQVVDNGKKCLDLLMESTFEIVILDIKMPFMTGDNVLKEMIKEYNKINKLIPYTIAVTAYCMKEDKDKYLNMGFDDYIPKPVSIDNLKKSLNKFIENMLQN